MSSKESTVISNLHHFTSYKIEIMACNDPVDLKRCSMATYVSARTMPEGEKSHLIEHVICEGSPQNAPHAPPPTDSGIVDAPYGSPSSSDHLSTVTIWFLQRKQMTSLVL